MSDRGPLEGVGLGALDRFIETFNSRDPAAWAASLSYPHVRVSPRRAAEVVPTEAQYAAAVTYDAADAMGWDHSEWERKQILAVSAAKIHASAQWCRYNAAGERILPNDVSYVITDVDGRWGIQARFGVDSPPPDDPSETARQAQQVWTRFWEAVAAGRADDVAPLVRLPFDVIGRGAVDRAADPSAVVGHLVAAATAAEVDDITPLQVGRLGVNLGVEMRGPSGRTDHGLFLVTLDETPRVAAASLLRR